MTRRHLVALTAVAGLILGSANAFARGAAAPAPTVESSATPTRVAVPVRLSSYPVYDRHGRRVGAATWRISPAGGNCCETYVSATPGGRIVESGGTYPWYTDDNGRHWYQVKFDIPDQNDNGKAIAGGEGATVVVGSDVYGVTWDAYSGDHLQAYRYTAQTDSWRVSEVALKTPFYDRPWLTYAQGRFTLDGEPTKQLLDVMGGGVTKDVETLSADGLRYGDASYPYLDEQQSPAGRVRVRVARNPLADWWQPYAWTGTLPLTGGGLLRFDNGEDVSGSSGCATARLVPSSATWQCVRMPARFRGVVRQDSRGYLTEVYPGRSRRALVLATSRDGGVHWRSVTLRPPRGAGRVLETPDMFDVVANGRLRQAVVSARFDDAKGNGHDMVFRVGTGRRTPRLLRTYLVGKGDINTANDVTGSAGYRFDYASVALLPNGRIAVSFDDSTCVQPSARDPSHRSPEVAILT